MRDVVKAILIVILSAVMASVVLTGVYLLPTERMKNHVESSIEIFYQEETYPQQVAGYKLSQLDNETDAIMLLNAIYPKGDTGAFKASMSVPRIDFRDDYSGRSELVSWLWLHKQPDKTTEYGRYWHGYLLFLKPLLLLLDYADIRILNMIAQLFLLAYLIVSMVEKGYKKYLIPLLVTEAIINPVAIAMSLQFSSVYYIVILSLLYICNQNRKKLLEKDFILFTLLGIATAFFDFLTYPLATLGMAAVFMLIKSMEENDWKKNLILVMKWCVFWGIGYVGMWAGKWVIASFVLQKNIMMEVFRQAKVHTSDVVIMGQHYNILQIVFRNIKVFAKWPYLLLGLGIGVWVVKNHVKLEIRKWKQIIPFLIIAVLPILWLMVLKEHSGLLYWFTYRGLMVTVFSLLCGLWGLSVRGEPCKKDS